MRQWQSEISHPQSWLNKHRDGDHHANLESREFTVMCFLGFYKMITEDTMYEDFDLIEHNEQGQIKRWIFQSYMRIAEDNSRDRGLIQRMFDSTWSGRTFRRQ